MLLSERLPKSLRLLRELVNLLYLTAKSTRIVYRLQELSLSIIEMRFLIVFTLAASPYFIVIITSLITRRSVTLISIDSNVNFLN